jgi:hypothetical protein
MSDKDILQKVLENTEVIKKNTSKLEEKNKKLQEQLNEVEELAHKLNYPNTSAMCRTYMMILLENEEYQKTFVEFATVLKSESGEA